MSLWLTQTLPGLLRHLASKNGRHEVDQRLVRRELDLTSLTCFSIDHFLVLGAQLLQLDGAARQLDWIGDVVRLAIDELAQQLVVKVLVIEDLRIVVFDASVFEIFQFLDIDLLFIGANSEHASLELGAADNSVFVHQQLENGANR